MTLRVIFIAKLTVIIDCSFDLQYDVSSNNTGQIHGEATSVIKHKGAEVSDDKAVTVSIERLRCTDDNIAAVVWAIEFVHFQKHAKYPQLPS